MSATTGQRRGRPLAQALTILDSPGAQTTPARFRNARGTLGELMNYPVPERARRAMEAMLKMSKIDVAELERAADGA